MAIWVTSQVKVTGETVQEVAIGGTVKEAATEEMSQGEVIGEEEVAEEAEEEFENNLGVSSYLIINTVVLI